MTFGTRLRKHRERKRLSQKEVADCIGVSQTTYCNWETDVSSYQVKYLIQLANVFDISVLQLISEEVKSNNVKVSSQFTLPSDDQRTDEHSDVYLDLLRSKEEIIQLLKDENSRLRAHIARLEDTKKVFGN